MRALSMVKYHWRRRRGLALLATVLILLISTATLFYVRAEYATNMVVFQGGVARVEQGYGSLDLSFNYAGLLTAVLWLTAAAILLRERSFFITASAARWEFVLGMAGFTVIFALVLTGIGWLIGVLNRLSLPLLGMNTRQPWSLNLFLTGGNTHLARDLFLDFTGKLAAGGWAVLIVALLQRWWKQILILAGVGVVILIVLGVQVRLGAYTQDMANAARAAIFWLQDVFIPKIAPTLEKIFSESRTGVLALRDVGQFAVGFLLMYPVILRMKVK